MKKWYFAIYRGLWKQEPIEVLPGEKDPVRLQEIRVQCVDLQLDATLYDSVGLTRGWVRADGTWKLL